MKPPPSGRSFHEKTSITARLLSNGKISVPKLKRQGDPKTVACPYSNPTARRR
jgi:hypothetical protein